MSENISGRDYKEILKKFHNELKETQLLTQVGKRLLKQSEELNEAILEYITEGYDDRTRVLWYAFKRFAFESITIKTRDFLNLDIDASKSEIRERYKKVTKDEIICLRGIAESQFATMGECIAYFYFSIGLSAIEAILKDDPLISHLDENQREDYFQRILQAAFREVAETDFTSNRNVRKVKMTKENEI